VKEYHEKIKKPMSLDKIRRKLDVNDVSHYDSLQEVVNDVRLIFKNAYIFNPVSFRASIDVGAWYYQLVSLTLSRHLLALLIPSSCPNVPLHIAELW
jgi:Transcription factor involved in chromatin remodeling, contains bromodomain